MLEGEEWKYGEYPQLTPQFARNCCAEKLTILVDGTNWNRPCEIEITELTKDGEFCRVKQPRNDPFGWFIPMEGTRGDWIRTRDIVVLEVRTPAQTDPKVLMAVSPKAKRKRRPKRDMLGGDGTT